MIYLLTIIIFHIVSVSLQEVDTSIRLSGSSQRLIGSHIGIPRFLSKGRFYGLFPWSWASGKHWKCHSLVTPLCCHGQGVSIAVTKTQIICAFFDVRSSGLGWTAGSHRLGRCLRYIGFIQFRQISHACSLWQSNSGDGDSPTWRSLSQWQELARILLVAISRYVFAYEKN